MRNSIPATLLFAAILAGASLQSGAQIFRAYLASDGNDANPCTLAAPCRLLPAALTAVASGGEIWMLDSANYTNAPVNVAKSVTIIAIPGALGSIVALGGNALDINGAGIHVTLRNLNVIPFPGNESMNGVQMGQGASLTLEGCNVSGFVNGVRVNAPADVAIVDSVFRRNGFGVYFQGGANASIASSHFLQNTGVAIGAGAEAAGITTQLTVARTTMTRGATGVQVSVNVTGGAVLASVSDSTISGNTVHGAMANASSGATAVLVVTNSLITQGGTALRSQGGGAVTVAASGNTVTHNEIGFLRSSGTFDSAGNNVLRDNATPTMGTITPLTTL
jgi:hypothetical protein